MASPSISAPPPLPSSLVPTVTPASLSSLAIYNPSLGSTDSTLHNQLIFYTSRRGNAAISTNDKLRQIGLAQGIAEFARGFSSTDNCTSVETQRSRVVTLELEDGWWIHAAIDLTCLHNPTVQPPTQEWSSREVAPTQLLVAQIKRAYSQYRFLYGRFQMGWEKLERAAFCKRVEKFWLRWAWVRWEVVLHGSPVIDMLAEKTVNMAGGRLGKEEIGRQEKEFMEGWIRKESAHGLVDMVVSRFGEREVEAAPEDASPTRTKSGSPFWFWNPHRRSDSSSTKDPNKNTEDLPPVLMPSDGCVFKGIGAVEVNDVASYLSELYEKAEETYVVTGNGVRRKRRRKRPRDNSRLGVSSGESSPRRSTSTIRHAREDGPKPTNSGLGRNEPESPEVQPSSPISPDAALEAATPSSPPDAPPPADDPPPLQPAACDDSSLRFRNLSAANGKILNLLTFGWSSRVQSGSTSAPSEAGDGGDTDSVFGDASAPATSTTESEKKRRGAFLIGFQGDLELEDIDDDHEDSSGRITSRTVWLPRTPPSDSEEAENAVPHPLSEFKLVVYTNKPFIFAFLFAPHSRILSSPSFYRSLHHQLTPLLSSLPVSSAATKAPYNLLLTQGSVYTNLPPIPDPLHELPGWSRADALHVHTVILSMLQERGDRERSVRSVRGWWINWCKFEGGEGLVVRRAGEGKAAGAGGVDVGAGAAVDVKRYFEGLEIRDGAEK
ncbi:hypothetical protein BZA05DRAFT_428672 [Tricharina praecox]|uniref:uncharacterized protein n=1 Tax=Tricharina praecox TaxID=43433 RepID=UPI00221F6244|nr:uncharacterized protein BZA05DRAFT_428672 [Tricharina praecox]KAI5857095.1 hypothetical protein BZA05DRAFT_428672 [Tricharina praecox]